MRRILVVEDHAPFRAVVCSLLRQRSDLLVVGESADGLDAIDQAAALQPDVVLLDISLPRLNGVEVTTRLRTVIPRAKIVLVTNETSVDVIEAAFRRGACGYVHKPRLLKDLLEVIDAVERGGQVFAGSLDRIARGDSYASHHHPVLFWSTDAVFVDGFSRFIARALAGDHTVLALVTHAHEDAIRRRLQRSGVDIDGAVHREQCLFIDNDVMLSRVTVNDQPDEKRFRDLADTMIGPLAVRARRAHRKFVTCGECAPVFWARGAIDTAIELERLWDSTVADRYHVDTLCAYPATVLQEHTRAVRHLCAQHTAVEIR